MTSKQQEEVSWDKILPNDKNSANALKDWVPELFFGLKENELEEAMKPLNNLQTKQFLRRESQNRRDEEQKKRDEEKVKAQRELNAELEEGAGR
jgi:hypothetical protein